MKNILKFSFVLVVIFIFSLFTVANADTINYTITGGTDTSSGTEKIFSQDDVLKLQTSDSEPGNGIDRMGSDKWPDQNSYDENRYIEFLFNPDIPQNALISEVKITNEFQRSAALVGVKIEVWDGQSFVNIDGTTLGTTGEDHTDIIDTTSILSTPNKINSTKIRFLAYRETPTASGTTTKHDFIGLSITYSIPIAPTQIHLQVETLNGSIYNQNISVAPCDSEGNGVMKATPYCALEQAEILSDWSGLWINSINGILNDFSDPNLIKSWTWIANLDFSNFDLSAKQYELHSSDKILFYFETNPLKISANLTPTVGSELTVSLTQPDYTPWPPIWAPAVDGKIIIGSDAFDLDSNGAYKISITNTTPFTIKGQKTGYIESPSITITPTISNEEESDEENDNGGNGGGQNNPTTTFNVEKALNYLDTQDDNGSFGDILFTDWAAIAVASADEQASALKAKIYNYLKSNPLDSSTPTENERHSMALMALRINPYSGTGINYIQKITDSFDGTQFGDANWNNDIFALIVLANAGYSSSDEIISKDINYLLSPSIQPVNGFWGSIDMTAALIQALKPFQSITGVSDAINNASAYLKSTQDCNTGGWENVSSTSWVMQAESALGTPFNTTNCKTGLNYLVTQQTGEGSVFTTREDPVWTTSFAIAAASGKPWSEIMQIVSKPVVQSSSSGSGGLNVSNSSSILNNLNSSGTNIIENTNTQTPATNLVVCKKGDSFNTTTGQACTAILPIELVNIITDNTPVTNQKNKKTVKSNLTLPTLEKVGTPTSENVGADTLTANVVNTLPADKTIPKSVPIVLGTVSGLAILYLGLKFFIL